MFWIPSHIYIYIYIWGKFAYNVTLRTWMPFADTDVQTQCCSGAWHTLICTLHAYCAASMHDIRARWGLGTRDRCRTTNISRKREREAQSEYQKNEFTRNMRGVWAQTSQRLGEENLVDYVHANALKVYAHCIHIQTYICMLALSHNINHWHLHALLENLGAKLCQWVLE